MPQSKLGLEKDDDPLLDKQKPAEPVKRFKEEGDFLYGHVSGTTLEEFVVTKINRKNKA